MALTDLVVVGIVSGSYLQCTRAKFAGDIFIRNHWDGST